MKWILCSVRLPPVHYVEDMNYWYSNPVMADNGTVRYRMTLKSHDGIAPSWGTIYGGPPYMWLDETEPNWKPK